MQSWTRGLRLWTFPFSPELRLLDFSQYPHRQPAPFPWYPPWSDFLCSGQTLRYASDASSAPHPSLSPHPWPPGECGAPPWFPSYDNLVDCATHAIDHKLTDPSSWSLSWELGRAHICDQRMPTPALYLPRGCSVEAVPKEVRRQAQESSAERPLRALPPKRSKCVHFRFLVPRPPTLGAFSSLPPRLAPRRGVPASGSSEDPLYAPREAAHLRGRFFRPAFPARSIAPPLMPDFETSPSLRFNRRPESSRAHAVEGSLDGSVHFKKGRNPQWQFPCN